MAHRPGSRLQEELLRMLRPRDPRREEQLSERVRPGLAEVGRTYVGRPPEEIVAALEAVIRVHGGTADRVALAEFAQQIAEGENPFD
jgi:hypothetical protein